MRDRVREPSRRRDFPRRRHDSLGVPTIYVKLMDEAVDVWRPVDASLEGDDTYRLANAPMPTEEAWEFQPGSVVRCERRDLDGEMSMVAVALA